MTFVAVKLDFIGKGTFMFFFHDEHKRVILCKVSTNIRDEIKINLTKAQIKTKTGIILRTK